MHYAAFQLGGEMVACGEDWRHALGSTKKEGLKFGLLLTTQRPGRAGQNEVVHLMFSCKYKG